jgi:hypothetical protein
MTNACKRESSLIATIRKKLPEFAKACADDTELVLLHQDAFAADYQEDEYMLLGMAIKYAGLRGKEVRVIGKNRSSLGERRGGPGRDSGDFYQKGTQLHGKLGRFCVSTIIASPNGALPTRRIGL